MRSRPLWRWVPGALGLCWLPGCLALEVGGLDESGAVRPGSSCGSSWRVSGSLQLVSGRGVSRSIDYGGGRVTVLATHKRDVDVDEDGCLGRLELRVAQAADQCEVKLVFERRNGSLGGLVEMRFSADSECPGFPDADEGLYFSASGFAPWSVQGLPGTVPEHDTASLCQGDVRLTFASHPVRLYRSGSSEPLSVDVGGLVLSGGLLTQGDTDAKCFDVSSCGPGWHDGGDGWCVEAGRCSPGFSRTATGECTR